MQSERMEGRAGKLPDFLILGAAKCGTTALFGALSRHPRVYAAPVKEPFFLAYVDDPPDFPGLGGDRLSRRVISDYHAYEALFADCPPGAVAGEATAEYLYSPTAPAAASAFVPKARLVAILRHPVERAYSQYLHMRHEGLEPLTSFEAAWGEEDARIAKGWPPVWHYRARGFYGEQLRRWLDAFPREQLLIELYDDWLHHPEATLARICEHLGIEPNALPVKRENVSSQQPRWPWLHHRMVEDNALRRFAARRLPLGIRDAITHTVGAVNLRTGPMLDPPLRARLAAEYSADLDLTEALCGRDLTAWRR